jgi:hypothetical protein
MKVTIDLTDSQASAVVAFGHRLNLTPPDDLKTRQLRDLQQAMTHIERAIEVGNRDEQITRAAA